jgi:hypothetical protein
MDLNFTDLREMSERNTSKLCQKCGKEGVELGVPSNAQIVDICAAQTITEP